VVPRVSAAQPAAISFPLTGDTVIDSTTEGARWDVPEGRALGFSVSGGVLGETWEDPAHVAMLMAQAAADLALLIDVPITFLGTFSTPTAAAAAGSVVNLSLDGTGTIVPDWAAAIGYFPDLFKNAQAGDIIFNADLSGDLSAARVGDTAYFILLHEIGHAMGLKHPHDDGGTGRPTYPESAIAGFDVDTYTVMSYNDALGAVTTAFEPVTFMLFDTIALQAMYGANPATNTGDQTHILSPDDAYRTLYDASGTDTLDCTAFGSGVEVVLGDWFPVPGSATALGYVATFELAQVNVPTTLCWLVGGFENVLSGAGDDVIYDNAADNLLDGGAGDDVLVCYLGGVNTLIGGDGADAFVFTLGSGASTVTDFEQGTDSLYLIDMEGNALPEASFARSYTQEGHEVFTLEDGSTITLIFAPTPGAPGAMARAAAAPSPERGADTGADTGADAGADAASPTAFAMAALRPETLDPADLHEQLATAQAIIL